MGNGRKIENIMALDQHASPIPMALHKHRYAVGEMPSLGHVPGQMYGWTIQRERPGAPEQAFQVEVVNTLCPDGSWVLVMVMAAGRIATASGQAWALRSGPFDIHDQRCRIAGSDASGVV